MSIEELAIAQGGVVMTRQALAAGIPRSQLGRRLPKIRFGVYALSPAYADLPRSERTALAVAAERLVTGVDLVAVGPTAAAIHDLPILGHPGLHLRERREDRPRHNGHSATLQPPDVVERFGVPVTASARTVVDVARRRGFLAGVITADAALRVGVDAADIDEVLSRARGWRGVEVARRAARFADPGSESPLESLGRVRMDECGLPAPALQVLIADRDGPFARVDHYWEKYRTVGEADGAMKYDGAGSLFEEKRREDRLRDMGLAVVRYTWDEMYRHPQLVTARFERAFARSTRGAA